MTEYDKCPSCGHHLRESLLDFVDGKKIDVGKVMSFKYFCDECTKPARWFLHLMFSANDDPNEKLQERRKQWKAEFENEEYILIRAAGFHMAARLAEHVATRNKTKVVRLSTTGK